MKYIWITLSFIYLTFTSPYFIYASQLDKNKALFNACGKRDFLAARTLLEQNADPNYQDPVSKDTPLVVANRDSRSRQSSFLITDLLIRHKANVEVANHIGKHALYYAASSAERASFLRILHAGAHLAGQLPNNKGENILNMVRQELKSKDLSKFKRYKLQQIGNDISTYQRDIFNTLDGLFAQKFIDYELLLHICDFRGTRF